MNWKLAALLYLTSSLAFGSDNMEDGNLIPNQKPSLVKISPEKPEGRKRKREVEELDNFSPDAKQQKQGKVKQVNLLRLPNALLKKVASYLGQYKISLVEDDKFQLSPDSLEYQSFALSCKQIYQALQLSKKNKGELFKLDCNEFEVGSPECFSDILSLYGTRISTIELQPTNLKHFLPSLISKKGENFLPRLKNLNLEIYDENLDDTRNSLTANEIIELGECLNRLKIENLRIGVRKLEDIIPAFEKMHQALANIQKLNLFTYFVGESGDFLKDRLKAVFSKMKNLKHFSANNFDIEASSASLSVLTSLSNLDMSFGANQITPATLQEFNDNIIRLLNLRELKLSGFGRNPLVLPNNFLKLPSLIRLSIIEGNFESSSRKIFFQQLPSLTQLEFLDLTENKLDDTDAQEIGNSLLYLATLKELDLNFNVITRNGLKFFTSKYPFLFKLKLEKLNLRNNPVAAFYEKNWTTVDSNNRKLSIMFKDTTYIPLPAQPSIYTNSLASIGSSNNVPFSFLKMLME